MTIYSTTKKIQFEQTYNTFKHRLSNYQIPVLYFVGTTITFIMNTPFPSFPVPFPNTRYSSSSTTLQYNIPE